MQLGFVGLGKMGLNMVTRLVTGGHEIVAYDRDTANCTASRESAAATACRFASDVIPDIQCRQ